MPEMCLFIADMAQIELVETLGDGYIVKVGEILKKYGNILLNITDGIVWLLIILGLFQKVDIYFKLLNLELQI